MYPYSITKAYDMICKYKTPVNITRPPCNCVNVSFHQQGSRNQTSTPVAGTNDVLHRNVMSYNCDRIGHYSGQFSLPDRCRTVTQSLRIGYSFAHTTPFKKDLINPHWVLLDSCSTVSSDMDPSLLSDIKYCVPIWIYMCLQMVGIYTLNSLAQ